MILTRKAKEDFLEYLDVEEKWFNEEYIPLFECALIIEWFDNIDIICNAVSFEKGSYWKAICDNFMLPKKYKSRQEAINAALIKANEIYNS